MKRDSSSIGDRIRRFRDHDINDSKPDEDDAIDFNKYNKISLGDDGIIDIEIDDDDDEIVIDLQSFNDNNSDAVVVSDEVQVSDDEEDDEQESGDDNFDDIEEVDAAVIREKIKSYDYSSREKKEVVEDDIDTELNNDNKEEFGLYDEEDDIENKADEDDHANNKSKDNKSKKSLPEKIASTLPVEKNNNSIKVRAISLQPESSRINKFDLFFIKTWSVIVTIVAYCANGVNYLIGAVFKKKAPLKYVKAGVVILFCVLLLITILIPVSASGKNNNDSGLALFNSNLLPVRVEVSDNVYKWGYIHKKHAAEGMSSDALVIPAIYEEALPFSKQKVAWVKVENEAGKQYWQIINTKGKRVGARTYEVENSGVKPVGEFTDDNLCWVTISGKYGYINSRGDIEIDPTYEYATNFVNGIAAVGYGGKQWYISTKEKTIGRYNEYDDVYVFTEGLGAVCKGKWGFVDTKGREIVSLQYDAVTQFIDGLAMVKMGETFGVIDTSGRKVVSNIEYNDIYVNNDVFRAFVEKHSNIPRSEEVVIADSLDMCLYVA